MSRSGSTNGSNSMKKTSTVHVARLRRQSPGRFKIEMELGADNKHYAFLMRFYNALVSNTQHETRGATRDEIRNILLNLYPNGKYVLHYNSILRATIIPKKLFI